MPDRGVGEDVDAFELHPELGQDLDHRGGEAALREDRGALHVKKDIVVGDVVLDAFGDGVVHGIGSLPMIQS